MGPQHDFERIDQRVLAASASSLAREWRLGVPRPRIWICGLIVAMLNLAPWSPSYASGDSAQRKTGQSVAVETADAAPRGETILTQFDHSDYQGNPTVWGVAQDSHGVLYVADGHRTGLLEMDGERWRRIPGPAHTRAVAVARDGKVYVGRDQDLGYLERAADGSSRYVSLLDQLETAERPRSEIAWVVDSERGVLFLSLEALYIWRDGQMRVIHTGGGKSIYRAYAVAGGTYLAQWQVGLVELSEDLALVPVTHSEGLSELEVNGLLESAEEGVLWAVTRRRGIFALDSSSLRPVSLDLQAELQSAGIQYGTQLADGRSVLVGSTGPTFVIDRDGTELARLDRSAGLATEAMHFAMADQEGALWLGGSDGLLRWQPDGPIRRLSAHSGLDSPVAMLHCLDSTLYAGTIDGLYSLDKAVANERFKPVPDVSGAVVDWHFLAGELLVATVDGLYRRDRQGRWHMEFQQLLRAVRGQEGSEILLVGTWNRLLRMHRHSGEWESLERGGLMEETWQIEPGPGRTALARTAQHQLVVLDDPWSTAGSGKVLARLEIPEGSVLLRLGGETLLFDNKGLSRVRRLQQGFVLEAVGEQLGITWSEDLAPDVLVEAEDGTVWQRRGRELEGWVPTPEGRYQSRWPSPRLLPDNFLGNLHGDSEHPDLLWLSAHDGLYRLAVDVDWEAKAMPVLLREHRHYAGTFSQSAAGSPQSEDEDGQIEASQGRIFPASHRSVRFSFAAPHYAPTASVRYRYRLHGQDDDWSSWDSGVTEQEYMNLHHGRYTFNVQARSGAGEQTELSYHFAVLAPWYHTWWARSLAVLLIGALVIAVARWRSSHLRRANRQLEGEVRQRTVELRADRDELARVNQRLEVEIIQRKQAESARRTLEEKVLQAQKMESLGVLAGGIAHDFNNLLVGVLGNAELARARLGDDSVAHSYLKSVELAAQRAAELCRQMLAYSGKGQFLVGPVDLNSVAVEMEQLLQASVPKKVKVEFRLQHSLPKVEGDSSQLRQVVMNLILNATEAVGESSGTVSVSTSTTTCDHQRLQRTYLGEPLEPGDYVAMEVTDDGSGMDEDTLRRIFDPFFTTKFAGRGLGLAAVLGIVRGHRGAMEIQSGPGLGTTFRVLLPAMSDQGQTAADEAVVGRPLSTERDGAGLVLVVDDEETVLRVASSVLSHAGFRVLTAVDGVDALRVFELHASTIDCVVLDLTMPRMDGLETLQHLRAIRADARIILSSGWGAEELPAEIRLDESVAFLSKPYHGAQMVDTVCKIIGHTVH